MQCPKCGAKGFRRYKGYCTKVHYQLDHKKPKKVRIQCTACGEWLIRKPSAIAESGRAFCKGCGKNPGEYHPKWKEGQFIQQDGYRMVYKNGSYLREHRVVWQEANKACLLPGTPNHIHHVDFDKLNNSPGNLVLFSDQEHSRFHRFVTLGRRKEAADLLAMAGKRQLNYPEEIDRYIYELLTSKS